LFRHPRKRSKTGSAALSEIKNEIMNPKEEVTKDKPGLSNAPATRASETGTLTTETTDTGTSMTSATSTGANPAGAGVGGFGS
jgi:hypothetical protein